jgi:uncharacterized protein YegL
MKLETGSAYRPVVGLSTNGPPACKWIDAGQWRRADPRYNANVIQGAFDVST